MQVAQLVAVLPLRPTPLMGRRVLHKETIPSPSLAAIGGVTQPTLVRPLQCGSLGVCIGK